MSFRDIFDIFGLVPNIFSDVEMILCHDVNSYARHYIFANFGKIRSTLNNVLLRTCCLTTSCLDSLLPHQFHLQYLGMSSGKKIPMKLFNQVTFFKSFDKLHHILVFEFATSPITENVLFWEGSCLDIKLFQACKDCILALLIIVKHV